MNKKKSKETRDVEFISLLVHQLKIPLAKTKWMLSIVLNEDVGKLNEEQKDFFQRIYENNENIIKLVDDLLDVAKIKEGKKFYSLKKENIVEIIKEILPSLKEKTEKKGIEIFFDKSSEIPNIKIDREKIKACIQNLAENAIKYTNEGQINLSLEKKKNEIYFYVKDTGIGIPQKQQKNIFSKFFKTTGNLTGSGLGLYITKKIIEAHNGEVGFTSKEKKGSTFYFSLPI